MRIELVVPNDTIRACSRDTFSECHRFICCKSIRLGRVGNSKFSCRQRIGQRGSQVLCSFLSLTIFSPCAIIQNSSCVPSTVLALRGRNGHFQLSKELYIRAKPSAWPSALQKYFLAIGRSKGQHRSLIKDMDMFPCPEALIDIPENSIHSLMDYISNRRPLMTRTGFHNHLNTMGWKAWGHTLPTFMLHESPIFGCAFENILAR